MQNLELLSDDERVSLFKLARASTTFTDEQKETTDEALEITEQEVVRRYFNARLFEAQQYLSQKHGISVREYRYLAPLLLFSSIEEFGLDNQIFNGHFIWEVENDQPPEGSFSPKKTLIEIIWPLIDSDYEYLIDHELGHWIHVQIALHDIRDDPHGQEWVSIMSDVFQRDEAEYKNFIKELETKDTDLLALQEIRKKHTYHQEHIVTHRRKESGIVYAPMSVPPTLKVVQGEQMMSSKQIAELLDVRHDNVKRTMERLSDRDVISFTPMEDMIEVGKGAMRQTTVYYVNERNSYIVVAQLSPEFTALVVDEWKKLREMQPQIPQTYAGALLLAANQAKQLELMEAKQLEDAPKVDLVDTLMVEDKATVKLGDFGRMLKNKQGMNTGAKKIFIQLRALGIIRPEVSLPYSRFIGSYFDIKEREKYGSLYPYTLVTPKGQVWLLKKMREAGY